MSDFEQNVLDDEDDSEESASSGGSEFSVTLRFPPVTKKLEEAGHHAFDNPVEYYKTLMSEGKDTSARLHTLFQKYTQAKDPKDKTVFRMQLINPFWEHLGAIARGSVNGGDPHKYALRFGILHPSLISAELRDFFSRIVVKSFPDISVHYLDEWIRHVGLGKIRASTTDETPVKRANSSGHMSALLDKASGKIEGNKALILDKNSDRARLEESLVGIAKNTAEHGENAVLPEVADCYSDDKKRDLQEIQDVAKALLRLDREMSSLLRELENAMDEASGLRSKLDEEAAAAGDGEEGGGGPVDTAAIDTEFGSVRQMAKMTIGRQGNAFPVLTTEFYRCQPATAGTKENVLALLAWIESIDSEVFWRAYKGKPNRIVPHVILLPTYGDFGVCWEPYDKRNKATSRGRVAVPMYPKNLTIAVMTAVADFRWQVAKEIASYYWMEEGLTGNYYQWFQGQKLKGDVKMFFIQDYILWLTKESEGTQKLPKEVRNTFWRFLPFPQTLKDKLKDRNLIYQELYQKDLNRAMSDGY
ncbi:MAG: hypothetical protein LBC72_05690 [Spirochaetaceae bacterium]|jgi:5'-deoxynucleotidase YfbR-like HD superfamily hydrolase|nr:hypothetical protein [Spirochaetaceae bacterium]